MSSNSIACNPSFTESFLKAFSRENNPDFAVNWAMAMCCCAGLAAVLGMMSGAEFAGNICTGLSLLCAVCFIVTALVSDKSSTTQKTETLEEFLEEHSFVKEYLE